MRGERRKRCQACGYKMAAFEEKLIETRRTTVWCSGVELVYKENLDDYKK